MRRRIIAAAVAAPFIFGSCSTDSGQIAQEYEDRNFLHLSGIASTYPELGPAICYTSRDQGENQLREISRNRDGYQDWIFIKRDGERFWANLAAEFSSVNALGYHLFSRTEIKSLRLIRKGDHVTHYVTCPDTAADIDYYSLKRNLPSPRNFIGSKSIKDKVESKGGIFSGSISISPHMTCGFGNTENYSSEPSIASKLYGPIEGIFLKESCLIEDSQFERLRESLEKEGLFLRARRHQDNQQR